MNGIHDLGGMHGLGPVKAEANEPVFHERWEGRVWAIDRALRAWRKWNIDTGRYYIEKIEAAEYLRMSYYERWFARQLALLVKTGLVSADEIQSGRPAAGAAKATPALLAGRVPSMALGRGIEASRDPSVRPRFKPGQRVRTRNTHPTSHTRLPRYARGKVGKIVLDHGVYNFPDSNAEGQGPRRQHVYAVRFAAQELWGQQASPRDSVHLDLWDDYLERA